MAEILENEIKIENSLEKNNNENIEKQQNKFLDSVLGKTINTGVDIALRAILPNAVEDQLINMKNIFLKEGLKQAVKSGINSAINLGKSAVGIVTGKFENVSQAFTAIKKGGIIDNASKAVDNVVKSANKNGLIDDKTAKLIKGGKNVIKESISSNIESTYLTQIDNIEKIGKYINNWNQYLEQKDLKGMNRELKKINEKLEDVLPLENTLKEVEAIKNIHELIKNKDGKIENLTEEEIELAKKLI